MAKVIMVQGTMSNVGKSLVVAGLCRVFAQDGYKVCPFKSQNMALNSYITKEGLEMGRAQVMQAEAAGIEPSVLMNPILLKPTSDMGSQVIVNGAPIGTMKAAKYYEYKQNLIPVIREAFSKLSNKMDIIVIEGAGSPAEINLKDNDIVNMGMAAMVDAPVLLVGDIDRGGVFAQLLGTMLLLEEEEKDRVKGLVINKFRGDKSILDPGIKMLEDKAGIPVVGTLPYTYLSIDDEDSLSERTQSQRKGFVNIAVIKLPRMSNFSDFMCFEQIDDVSVVYVQKADQLKDADMVIIPGSKNTIADLKWLRESGLEAAIIKYSSKGIVFGICGGFQMLGTSIDDPYNVEEGGHIAGMGLLNISTVLTREKTRTQLRGCFESVPGELSFLSGKMISGYEIHMGETTINEVSNLICINNVISGEKSFAENEMCKDGACEGNVYGTYIHGIFDEGDIAVSMAKYIAEKKGLNIGGDMYGSFDAFKNAQYDKLADMIRQNMDMDVIYNMLRESKV